MIIPPDELDGTNAEDQNSGFEVEDIEAMLDEDTEAKRVSKVRIFLIVAAVIGFFAILIFLLFFTFLGGFTPD